MSEEKENETNEVQDHSVNDKPSWARVILGSLAAFGAGIVFGFSMEKGRVFEPIAIRFQMVFSKWIMMKMFLAAMATGLLCFGILSLIPFGFVQRHFTASVESYGMKRKNSIAVIVGPFILGVGMTLSGACPGMVLPQVGAWTTNAIFTLIGALVGTLVYGLLHDRVYQKVFPDGKFCVPALTLHEWFGIKFAYIALPMGAVVYGAVIVLEIVVPWKKDISWGNYYNLSQQTSATNIFSQVAWAPSVCGTLIGLMQLVIVFAALDTLGGTSSYVTVVSQLFCTKSLQQMFPYMASKRCGFGNWWQVLYVIGGIVGGAISAALSDTIGSVGGVGIGYALIGGFCLTFGARIASGCTSGHGLSGMGLLFLSSFLAVPAMFAGAIITGIIMKYGTNNLDSFSVW